MYVDHKLFNDKCLYHSNFIYLYICYNYIVWIYYSICCGNYYLNLHAMKFILEIKF